jgi:hypothetical protein
MKVACFLGWAGTALLVAIPTFIGLFPRITVPVQYGPALHFFIEGLGFLMILSWPTCVICGIYLITKRYPLSPVFIIVPMLSVIAMYFLS